MTDVVRWLNQNDGAAIVVLTAFLVIFNAWLLLETRSTRIEKLVANVDAYPMLWDMASMYLAGRVENAGPAVARDLEWLVTLRGPDGKEIEPMRRYAQPMFAPEKYRTMMLDPRNRGSTTALRQLADEGMVIDVEWSWTDGRRRWPFGPHARHTRTDQWDCKQLSTDFFEALILTETPPMLKLSGMADEVKKAAKDVRKIPDELRRLRWIAERAFDDEPEKTGPEPT